MTTPQVRRPEPASRVAVPFRGAGAGTDSLSWGQQELYAAMCRQNNWCPIGLSGPVPAGTTLDDVLAEVRFAMSRYPSMRTRLRTDPDGGTRQVVYGHGELTVEVYHTPAGADPGQLAEQVRLRYWHGGHDHETDWPVQVGVVCQGGTPVYVAVVLCHLVTDGFGSMVLYTELAGRDRGAGSAGAPDDVPADVPVTAMTPLDQVAWQRSPAGQRQSAAALAHWERTLRVIAPRRFPGTADAPFATTGEATRPRHWEGEFVSPALHLAAERLRVRTNVDHSPLMLAIFAVALARITAVNPVVVQVVVSNRFRPRLARTVSPVNQTGLCVLDVAQATVDEAIRRTAKAVLVAYKHAYYDPTGLEALVERLGRERGEPLDIACYFNDRRAFNSGTAATGVPPGAARIRAAVADHAFAWARRQDDPWERLFLHLNDVPDTVAMTVQADSHYLSPVNMRELVFGMESIAVRAALDPDTVTGVPVPVSAT